MHYFIRGLFHLMNHAIFKCALFMGVGIIDHEGMRDIRRLSGMRKFFPKMNLVMTLALRYQWQVCRC